MTHNLNTTINKVALEIFNKNYNELNKTQQQTCNNEMVNNDKWLAPFWKQPGYMTIAEKWEKGLPLYNDPQPKF